MNIASINKDSRLIKAYELMDAGQIGILSLDIFDTLLWRKILKPQDLFILLGRLLKKEGWLVPGITKEIFAELRVESEKVVRREKETSYGSSEITLPEIYWALQDIFIKISIEEMLFEQVNGIYESDVSKLVSKEVSLEKELIHFDANILNLILYAAKKNIRVILVSDTYFESKEIGCFLGNSIDHIYKLYLSCEYGLGKQEGLFKKIIDDLRVDPESILHIGDNEKSDISFALKEKINTIFYSKCDDELEKVLKREWTDDLYKRSQLLDPKHGDFGISALRAKVTYHTDLKTIQKDQHFFWKYGGSILGPILFGFIHWIHKRCQERGENKVFCLMGEGQLYVNLIKHFSPSSTYELKPESLWASRFFIIHASMMSANKIELKNVMKKLFHQFTLETSCSFLGLDIHKIPKWSLYKHVTLEDPDLLEEFTDDVSSNIYLAEQILQAASLKRKRFIKYLSGFTDLSKSSQMTLVDIGWNGTIQEALQKIFIIEGFSIKLHGLYLGTTRSTHSLLLRGMGLEGYLINCGHPIENIHLKGCFVLEQTACAETGVGSLKDIDDQGQIITSPYLISEKQGKQAKLIQKGILAFFDQITPYIKSGEITWDSNSEALKNQLRSILVRSMVNTTYTEAHRLGSWQHDHAPTPNLTQVIGKDSYYERFIKDMLPIAVFKESAVNWPSAYAAKNSKYLTLISQAMWLKTLPYQCLLSEDEYLLRIYLDKGRGFTKKAYQKVTLRSNPNRNFYSIIKVFSSKMPIQKIQLSLSFPTSLVRIKSLRFIIFDKRKKDPQHEVLFESEENIDRIDCITEKRLDFNTFYCNEDLKLIRSFTDSDIHQIRIKLCCEKFEMKNM